MSDTATLSIGTAVEADVLTPSPIAYVDRGGLWPLTRWQGEAVVDGTPVPVQGVSFGDLAPDEWQTCEAQPVPTLPKRAVRLDPDTGQWFRSRNCPLPLTVHEVRTCLHCGGQELTWRTATGGQSS